MVARVDTLLAILLKFSKITTATHESPSSTPMAMVAKVMSLSSSGGAGGAEAGGRRLRLDMLVRPRLLGQTVVETARQ